MQLYNVTWQFPEIEGQKAAYAKLIDYMASGAQGDHIDGFELISRTHCPQTGSGVVICKAENAKVLFLVNFNGLNYSAAGSGSGATAIITPVASPKSPAFIILPSSLKVK